MTFEELKALVIERLVAITGQPISEIKENIVNDVIHHHNNSETIRQYNSNRIQAMQEIKILTDKIQQLDTQLNAFIESSYNDFWANPIIEPETALIEVLPDSAMPEEIPTSASVIPENATDTEGGHITQSSHSTNQNQDMRFGNASYTPSSTPIKKIYFDNGEEDKNYCFKIDWTKLGLSSPQKIRFVGLEDTGLTYQEADEQIMGLPTQTGELTFQLEQEVSPNKWTLLAHILLFIKPDTRKMFDRQIEPPADAPYIKAHTDKCRIAEGDKTVIAASKRGRSHAMDGKFRDDDMISLYKTEGWYILAVADGAGSAKYSRRGSQIACKKASDIIYNSDSLIKLEHFLNQNISDSEKCKKSNEVQSLMYQILGTAAFEARKAIVLESQNTEGATEKDYATTLLLSIVKKVENSWFIGSYWVGDGGIGIYLDEQSPIIMGTPDSGEFSGQTRFLTMNDIFADYNAIMQRIKIEIVPDFKALVLMTDGITDALFQTEANLERKNQWDEFYKHLTQEVTLEKENSDADSQLLAWLDFWVKGEYDDRTISILF